MKLILRIVCIGVLTYFVSPFVSWWLCMVVAFMVSFVSPSSGLNSFIAGFLGVGLVWMGHSAKLDLANNSAFSVKVGEIMSVSDSYYLILAAGVIGGLASGFASITGSAARGLFKKSKQRSLYN